MGTYTELTVAGYPLITSKSAVVPEVMTVFRESDRCVFVCQLSERNPLVWSTHVGVDEAETAIEYSCETRCVIDRLNIMGFTLARVREEFEGGREYELKECEQDIEDGYDWRAERLEIMSKLTFDAYAPGGNVVKVRPRRGQGPTCEDADVHNVRCCRSHATTMMNYQKQSGPVPKGLEMQMTRTVKALRRSSALRISR